MDLNLIDQLTLLALDDEKGTFIPDSTAYAYALAGAVVLELALEEKITILDNKIRVKVEGKVDDALLDAHFQKIRKSSKNRSVKYWIEQFGNVGHRIKEDTVRKLVEKKILEKKEGKILWIFTYSKYPVHNPAPENQLRKRLSDIIVGLHKPELKEYMLLNLVKSCQLEKEVFGRDHVKTFRTRMKSLSEGDHLASTVTESIREVIETISVLLVVMIATVVATTTGN